jgi:tRNA-2-methylthio-N6-dimethylallyladenosine synthase
VQAGDDEVLHRMGRGYTADDYRRLVAHIRERIPGASIATDVIVGFPGETEAQFQRTYDLLAELRLDKAHIARYSPRPQTLAARRFPDDVPPEEKERRRKALDELQTRIVGQINARLLGRSVQILVEGRDQRKGRWWGRTRTDKLVFFEEADIDHASADIDHASADIDPDRLPDRTRSTSAASGDSERGPGGDWRGRLASVRITWTGPWSLIGEISTP